MSGKLDFCIVCDDQWELIIDYKIIYTDKHFRNCLTTIIDNRGREFTVCGRCEVAIEWYKTITDEVSA